MADFRDILESRGIPTAPSGHRHTRPGYINFDCPFCGPGSLKFHMGFSERRRSVSCWKCNQHSLTEVLKALFNTTWSDAKAIAASVGHRITDAAPIAQGKLVLPDGLGPLGRQHIEYLRSRGFDPETITDTWGVRGIGFGHALFWRLFIPIHYRQKIVSWTTRSLAPDAPQRYISAAQTQESYPHKKLLYGLDYCRSSIVVVEGAIGAWRFGPGTTATFGIAYSQAQVELMSRFPRRGICFDNEPVAQQRARDLVQQLSVFPGETFNIELDAADPGEASPREVQQVRRAFLE